VAFGLSREARERWRARPSKAIDQFRQGRQPGQGFGFAGYSLREVSVNSNEVGGRPIWRAP
jgi:hypothetical protein